MMSRLIVTMGAALIAVLQGCAGMMQATPQLGAGVGGDKKMEVKSKVMAVTTLDYSPDGRRLVSGGVTPMVRIWDMANGKDLKTHDMQAEYGIGDVAYSRDGKLIAVSGVTGLFGGAKTQVLDAETGRLIQQLPENLGFKLAFSADGQYVFAGRLDLGGLFSDPSMIVSQVDWRSGQVVRSFPRHQVGDVSRDGRHLLLIGNGRPGLMMYDLTRQVEAWRHDGQRAGAVAFLPDGRQFLASHIQFHGAVGSSATVTVTLNDAATGRQVREMLRYSVESTFLATDKQNQTISVLEISPDGSVFITGNGRGDYKLWDTGTGQALRDIRRPDERIVFDMSPPGAAFSPNGKLVAIASTASIRFYHTHSGEEAATLVGFDDGEWLVSTPSGYYNSSEKGDEYLSVSVNGSPFSIAQLRESFYRPDLVKVALAGGALKDYRRIEDLKPPPSVAFVDVPSSTRTARTPIVLEVSDQGGGIGDVRLYRNGSAVVLEAARSLAVVSSPETGGVRRMRFDLPLESGRNAIRAIAFNADNTMQSKDVQIEIEADISARPPALYAIVIGIQEFRNPRLTLKYSVADAEMFGALLESKSTGLYSAVRVKRLLKPEETTNDAIVAALKQAQREVAPEDLFVFFVASHGTVDDGQYLLITSNVGSTSTARLKQDALTQDALKDLISNIPASKKLVVLDTCSAGQLGDAIQVAMLTRGMSDETAMKVLSRAVGSTVLSAATSVQEAMEGYKNHGLFTYVIAEGLNGAADSDRDGYVKTLELADYVDSQVPEIADKVFKHRQYPIVSPTGQGFPLVKVH